MSVINVDGIHLPEPADPERAARGLARWSDVAEAADPNARAAAKSAVTEPSSRRLLEAIFGNSPFLGRLLCQEFEFSLECLSADPDELADRLRNELDGARRTMMGAELDRMLRIARRRMALLAALADLSGQWTTKIVTRRLSDFAGAAISAAVAGQLREMARDGAIDLEDESDPEKGSGLAILAMGKLGAGELNYSSDIDLIVLYDEDIVRTERPEGLQKAFVRLARALLRSLDEPTKDGYVFRTDLRLRPDPASTPLAVSMQAAETYYESTGQNWERAAMIKAHPIAGDLAAGRAFLEYLRPFVWRKNLDFAAIEDIHSIKRQIHAHRGGGEIKVARHNIKLGRGGIREIEFFAQTQQLIWGGRDPSIRKPATCDALRALAAAGHVAQETSEQMIDAYWFLRHVEHRLQMVDDRQTHELPADEDGLNALAVFAGFSSREEFTDRLIDTMRTVERHYGALFEESPTLSGPGNLVFTGTDDDPRTLETLAELGYDDPASVAAVIRGWHHGRYRAMRSTRARELLTELKPALLTAFAKTANPNAALMKFDSFLAGLPAGVQLFSLFHSNPALVDLLAEIMGTAPKLADRLGRNPGLFDAVLTEGYDEVDESAMAEELAGQLADAADYQDVLDIVRRWVKDVSFRVGVRILRTTFDGDQAGPVLSDAADAAIRALTPHVVRDFAVRHGEFSGGGMAVAALGKLGGREMTFTSDLDLIFIYDLGTGTEMSDGRKPLAGSHYFTRLSQRLLNALTVPTAEGVLYEVDMRLRPSGNKGPLASSLDAFRTYQHESAWTWEHMALTRARVITGPDVLCRAVETTIRDILTRPRDGDKLLRDVADMRRRIEAERPAQSPWDIKYLRGGLIDIEFIAQYLQLRHAHSHPEILETNTSAALDELSKAGLIDTESAHRLIDTLRLLRRVQGLLRLTVDVDFKPEAAPEGLRRALAATAGAVDFDALKTHLHDSASEAHRLFEELIDGPAAALPPLASENIK